MTIIRHMHCGAVHQRVSNLDPYNTLRAAEGPYSPRIYLSSEIMPETGSCILCFAQRAVKRKRMPPSGVFSNIDSQ
jgi:hypothetical protein